MTKIVTIDHEQKRLQVQFAELQEKSEAVGRSEFDVKRAMNVAALAQGKAQAKQWIKLRAIYQQLFSSVVVGAEKSDGSRDIEFILRGENAPGCSLGEPLLRRDRKLEDENCNCLKMVRPSGRLSNCRFGEHIEA